MPVEPFDAYWHYAELQQRLEQYASNWPELVRLLRIGQSHEGRPIWLLAITNFRLGEDTDKPALWIDANIHSAELVGSMAAMYLVEQLVNGYGKDSTISRCLDSRTFYICPRANPDGAEWALAEPPRLARSSTRPWPHQDTLPRGLRARDMDNDGRLLTMRIPDPNGPWKIHPDEPRLMVARDPAESGGAYYRLLPEGEFSDYDGITLPAEQRAENLDLNRNFPVNWQGEHEQPGAGPYPVSEPEVRAMVEFIASHDNICSAISLHSYSGVLLRPVSFAPDDTLPAEDRWVFDAIGKHGTDLTGYPAISAYEGFRYHPQKVITGAMDDWLYLHTGRIAWTVELWNPRRQAGIDDDRHIDWYREHPFEDDQKLLAWSDRELGGKGYIDWYPFEHPQLGRIELGGWDPLYSLWNPPPHLLQKEIAPLADWLTWHNLVSPKLEWHSVTTTRIAADTWQLTAVVQNTGWLPTDVTRQARDKRILSGIGFRIELAETIEILLGEIQTDAGQLEGRSHKSSTPTIWAGRPSDPTDERVKQQWLLRGSGTVTLYASHPRAGKLRQTLTLD